MTFYYNLYIGMVFKSFILLLLIVKHPIRVKDTFHSSTLKDFPTFLLPVSLLPSLSSSLGMMETVDLHVMPLVLHNFGTGPSSHLNHVCKDHFFPYKETFTSSRV